MHTCVQSHLKQTLGLQSWLPARDIVKTAVEQRQSVDPSGEIVKMTQYAPWKEHLHDLEEDLSITPPIKYVLYEVHADPLLACPCLTAVRKWILQKIRMTGIHCCP